jgi:hypothetical protein
MKKLIDFVGTDVPFSIGSTTYSKRKWDMDELSMYIIRGVEHYLFDSEFYYNWIDGVSRDEYRYIFNKLVIQPLLSDIEKTFSIYFYYGKEFEWQSDYDIAIRFKLNRDECRKIIDDWFISNTIISDSLKESYLYYRKVYYRNVSIY